MQRLLNDVRHFRRPLGLADRPGGLESGYRVALVSLLLIFTSFGLKSMDNDRHLTEVKIGTNRAYPIP